MPNNRPSKSIWSAFGSVALILTSCAGTYVLAAYLWFTADFRFYPVCFGTLFPSHQDVEENALFKFPSSGQNVEYRVISNKGGCTFWVKFEMNSADFNDSFTDFTLVKELSATTRLEDEFFSALSSQQGWSQPASSLAGYVEEAYPRQFQWIFIDTHDRANWTVYIITNHWPQFNS